MGNSFIFGSIICVIICIIILSLLYAGELSQYKAVMASILAITIVGACYYTHRYSELEKNLNEYSNYIDSEEGKTLIRLSNRIVGDSSKQIVRKTQDCVSFFDKHYPDASADFREKGIAKLIENLHYDYADISEHLYNFIIDGDILQNIIYALEKNQLSIRAQEIIKSTLFPFYNTCTDLAKQKLNNATAKIQKICDLCSRKSEPFTEASPIVTPKIYAPLGKPSKKIVSQLPIIQRPPAGMLNMEPKKVDIDDNGY